MGDGREPGKMPPQKYPLFPILLRDKCDFINPELGIRSRNKYPGCRYFYKEDYVWDYTPAPHTGFQEGAGTGDLIHGFTPTPSHPRHTPASNGSHRDFRQISHLRARRAD